MKIKNNIAVVKLRRSSEELRQRKSILDNIDKQRFTQKKLGEY